jgi:hypothetical protein
MSMRRCHASIASLTRTISLRLEVCWRLVSGLIATSFMSSTHSTTPQWMVRCRCQGRTNTHPSTLILISTAHSTHQVLLRQIQSSHDQSLVYVRILRYRAGLAIIHICHQHAPSRHGGNFRRRVQSIVGVTLMLLVGRINRLR